MSELGTRTTEAITAVYPGSFDPITCGHIGIVERASRLFDRVIVAVGLHPSKPGYFPVAERCELIATSLTHIPNAVAGSFRGLVVDYCRAKNARVIVRGLRAVGDFEQEFQMGLANRDLAPEIETVFLLPRLDQQFLSSSLIREIAGHGGEFERYVSPSVARALKARGPYEE
ncbi:MAG: pantetheine-phosphate adenylyltransferase [Nannocystaceae bacterium]